MKKNDSTPEADDYKGMGVTTDTAMTVANTGRMATMFIPGGHAVQSGADAAIAAVQGDVECTKKEEQKLAKAGVNADSNAAKWNPRIRGHVEKFRDRWKGRVGEAVVSGTGGGLGGMAGGAAGGALIGGFTVPIIGAPVGAVIGGAIGTMTGGYVANRGFNAVYPIDQKDDVDLTLQMVSAQKQGKAIPPEVVFAQWAAQQKGTRGNKLTADLRERTGYSNFNDAVEQGKMAELNAMMRNPNYEADMRSSLGMMVDLDNPNRHVADQMAEWINSGQLKSKDLLLGSTNLPSMSLNDAYQSGYIDPQVSQALDPRVQKAQETHLGMSV